MPSPDGGFDVVVCFTMLHHVPTRAGQDRLFAETRRVPRSGGTFAGSDSRWGALFAVAHLGDNLTLVDPNTCRRACRRSASPTSTDRSPGARSASARSLSRPRPPRKARSANAAFHRPGRLRPLGRATSDDLDNYPP